MRDFKNKNDYTCIVFYKDDTPPFKMAFVHNCYSLSQWLTTSNNHQHWSYFNVYVRRSNMFLKRFYQGNFIPAKPK